MLDPNLIIIWLPWGQIALLATIDRSTIDTDIQGSENHNNSNGNTPSDSLITVTPFIILNRRNWFNDNITPKTKIPKSIWTPRFCLTFANQQRMPPIKSYSNLWSFYCAKPNVRIVRKLINNLTLVLRRWWWWCLNGTLHLVAFGCRDQNIKPHSSAVLVGVVTSPHYYVTVINIILYCLINFFNELNRLGKCVQYL